jgi:hypothetical protein
VDLGVDALVLRMAIDDRYLYWVDDSFTTIYRLEK